MRTAEEFKDRARIFNIKFWHVHDCGICGYHCGFVIDEDLVYYDSGCDCVTYSNLQLEDWEAIAQHYNMQKHPDVIEEMNKFWHFN